MQQFNINEKLNAELREVNENIDQMKRDVDNLQNDKLNAMDKHQAEVEIYETPNDKKINKSMINTLRKKEDKLKD